jgi:hypothetical protein
VAVYEADYEDLFKAGDRVMHSVLDAEAYGR